MITAITPSENASNLALLINATSKLFWKLGFLQNAIGSVARFNAPINSQALAGFLIPPNFVIAMADAFEFKFSFSQNFNQITIKICHRRFSRRSVFFETVMRRGNDVNRNFGHAQINDTFLD